LPTFQIGAIANQSQQHQHSGRVEAIHIKKYAECEFSLVSGRRRIAGQFTAAGDLTMTVGETIAVAVAAVNVAYVLWGYRLRTALDQTKRHTPLSTDPAPRANSRDAVQNVARELAAERDFYSPA
jgi:hypothetical protein